eukprot:Gb_18507 [translate_table: standard]
MNSQKANTSTSRGRNYITSIEEETSRVGMEVVMVVEGEDISAESPTTVKEPIHCWMKSSEESPGLIRLGCTILCRDRVRGAETLLTFEAAGKNLPASRRPGRGEPAGHKSRGGVWSHRSRIKRVVDLGMPLVVPHLPGLLVIYNCVVSHGLSNDLVSNLVINGLLHLSLSSKEVGNKSPSSGFGSWSPIRAPPDVPSGLSPNAP